MLCSHFGSIYFVFVACAVREQCLSEAWVMNYWNSLVTSDVREVRKKKPGDVWNIAAHLW